MVYFLRSATIAPGKLVSAMSFAREVAAHIKAKMGIGVTVGTSIGGANRIGWFVEYENLAKIQTKLMQDQEYLQMVTKAGDSFVAGSLHDEIWRTV